MSRRLWTAVITAGCLFLIIGFAFFAVSGNSGKDNTTPSSSTKSEPQKPQNGKSNPSKTTKENEKKPEEKKKCPFGFDKKKDEGDSKKKVEKESPRKRSCCGGGKKSSGKSAKFFPDTNYFGFGEGASMAKPLGIMSVKSQMSRRRLGSGNVAFNSHGQGGDASQCPHLAAIKGAKKEQFSYEESENEGSSSDSASISVSVDYGKKKANAMESKVDESDEHGNSNETVKEIPLSDEDDGLDEDSSITPTFANSDASSEYENGSNEILPSLVQENVPKTTVRTGGGCPFGYH